MTPNPFPAAEPSEAAGPADGPEPTDGPGRAGRRGSGGAGLRRHGQRVRHTNETTVEVSVTLDASGTTEVDTGLPFFDHMLHQLGRHGGMDLQVTARGDLAVDAHHTVEDVGIVLGQALSDALGDKVGIRRFSSLLLPLDEALVQVALDVSGRPYLAYDLGLNTATPLGQPGFDPQLAEEFWRAAVTASGITLHIARLAGVNTHHVLEASFKAVARCLGQAVAVDGGQVPSTKGTL